MSSVLKYWLSSEDEFDPQNLPVTKLGVAMSTCNPGTGEGETGGSLGFAGQLV